MRISKKDFVSDTVGNLRKLADIIEEQEAKRAALIKNRLKLSEKFDSKSLNITIGHNLRKMRLERNLSQEELGKILGVTFQQVQKYEKGINRLSAANVYILAKAFGLGINDFFGN